MMNAAIPQEFSYLFWDVDFDKLDGERFGEFIVERLLEKGNWDEVRWMWRAFPHGLIKEIVDTSRNISGGTRGLWKMVLERKYSTPQIKFA
ncbi:hypothetical protein KKB83_04475 [Patescibacteria group bacterium]|nr:hypothetical protein [Patescibacteria group bacterium]